MKKNISKFKMYFSRAYLFLPLLVLSMMMGNTDEIVVSPALENATATVTGEEVEMTVSEKHQNDPILQRKFEEEMCETQGSIVR